MRFLFVLLLVLTATLNPSAQTASDAQARCEKLASVSLSGAKVTSATLVPAATALPDVKLSPAAVHATPSFCRVLIADKPSIDSDIRTEVWLPVEGWNAKFRAVGNGGFAGAIGYGYMNPALREGFATAGTDTGHIGPKPDFALGHPEKVTDFGWRAVHDMTVEAKLLIAAFYSKAETQSYFTSCSDGGREALMEAERFPSDYDGILAGAPAYNWTGLMSDAAFGAQTLHANAASNIPVTKLPAIAAAVRAACDAKDGVTDGILNNPTECHFDPAVLTCKESESDSCLTPAQVAVLKSFYAAKLDAHGKKIYSGNLPGAEDAPNSWKPWLLGDDAQMLFYGKGFFSNFVYEQPDWKLANFDLTRDYKLATEKTAAALNATDTNLQPFFSRGGRLILYQGWNDPAVPALGTLDFYNGVVARVGEKLTGTSSRLYMVPGMLHCGGGPGANSFGHGANATLGDPQHDIFNALEHWVEAAQSPGTLIATKFTDDNPAKPVVMTRPICVYPAEAKYNGGDANQAASFSCVLPKP